MSAVAGNRFYTVKEVGCKTYKETTLNIGTAAARSAGVKLSQVGTVVDCPTLNDLERLYQIFDSNVSYYNTWDSTEVRFKDLGRRAYFKVRGMIVQTWALVTYVNGKLTEGAGNPSIWLPVYCSFNASTDPIFDNPRVASLMF